MTVGVLKEKMNRVQIPGLDKAIAERKGFDRESHAKGSVYGGKHNQCVILPGNVSMVAEALERRNQNWFVRTKVANNLIIQVGDSNFHLHKLPMVSKCGYLNRLVFQKGNGAGLSIQIDNLPGGAKTFELVVKFCYGWKVDLTAANIAPLYCAAHFLQMSDDLQQGNLISKTETFLSFLIFSSWKGTFQILKSCESISLWVKELQILKRCSESIAWKACTNLQAFSSGEDDTQLLKSLEDNMQKSKSEGVDNWWFENVSSLRIDHFIEVIQSIKSKGMRSDIVGSCIAHWTAKWLSQITFEPDIVKLKNTTQKLQRVTIECLIRLLPTEENSVTCNFLLLLLKVGLVMKINSDILNMLERRIAYMLEICHVTDLLVKNHGDKDSVYDVGIVTRVVEYYVSFILSSQRPKIFAVGRLVDGYLTLIARDENLNVKSFRSLAEALPVEARFCDDNLYRATDMYLKAHPSLTEEERISICRFLEYHRLSKEAREHVMKNGRVPLKITTRFVLLQQVNMTKSMTSMGSSYRRSKTQAMVRVSKSLGNGCISSRKEIKQMSKEVETMKMQLNDLQICKLKLQKQLKKCTL
ncbi:coleoptile phototropism protein 1 [Ziziphus jujuba]|uniref:Coleoptile phototropism protein 1 n=1 Tax=Ziziphus jujuba TaxID=326968 RepID=A0A6P3ZBM1_ZIZJJ|nr:coleoptile phototropism protein 1 [Ziziphus jujuba]